MYEPANPAISTAAGLAVQCYAAGVEGGAYVYYFSMPDDAVTINVTFTPAEGPFDDVAATDWFCDEVLDAYEAGLMTGTGERTFSPGAPRQGRCLSRILYRLAGRPAAEGGGFTDVSASAYYASAVAWASQNGIVEGFEDGSFQPDAAITREQLAAVLYRCSHLEGRGHLRLRRADGLCRRRECQLLGAGRHEVGSRRGHPERQRHGPRTPGYGHPRPGRRNACTLYPNG